MKLFTLGEWDGPIKCEYPECGATAFTIVLSDAEYKSLEGIHGRQRLLTIFTKGLGKALCDKHLIPKMEPK